MWLRLGYGDELLGMGWNLELGRESCGGTVNGDGNRNEGFTGRSLLVLMGTQNVCSQS